MVQGSASDTFNAFDVEYLVVGAHTLAAHGHIRATKDLDVWGHATTDNADFATAGTSFQIGVPPLRVDVITAIDGVAFVEAWQARVEARLGEVVVPILSRRHLIQNKRATNRLQDRADVEWLENNQPRSDDAT